MSKSNTNKKLITNYSSPYLIPQNKEKIKKPSPNPHPPVLEIFQTKEENDRLGIMEVYEDNNKICKWYFQRRIFSHNRFRLLY